MHEDYEKLLKKVTALVVELPDESEQQKTAAAAVASAAASGKPGASLGGRKGLPAAKSTKDLARDETTASPNCRSARSSRGSCRSARTRQ